MEDAMNYPALYGKYEFLVAWFPYNALQVSLVYTVKSEFLRARVPYNAV